MPSTSNFIDVATIWLHAGKGGDGAVSFHREKFVAAGGPDGGDGGRGGNIVFQADPNLSTLMDFRYKRKYTAPDGENGRGARQKGKDADDLVIRVPRGTVLKEAETGLVVADLSGDAPVVVAKGVDYMAFKIREIAKANNVPIVENKPLARSLYKLVQVDQVIPAELYVAVAEILAFIYGKDGPPKMRINNPNLNPQQNSRR